MENQTNQMTECCGNKNSCGNRNGGILSYIRNVLVIALLLLAIFHLAKFTFGHDGGRGRSMHQKGGEISCGCAMNGNSGEESCGKMGMMKNMMGNDDIKKTMMMSGDIMMTGSMTGMTGM